MRFKGAFRAWTKPAAVLVLVLCAVLTGWAWQRSVEQVRARAADYFAYRVSEVKDSLEQRLAAYQQILHGAAGLVSATEAMSDAEWRRYVRELDLQERYPGIAGLGYAPYFERPWLPERTWEYLEGAGISTAVGTVPGRHAPVLHFAGRDDLLRPGMDLLADADQREAVLSARARGELAVSRGVRLGTNSTWVALYLPVYRRAPPPAAPRGRAPLAGFVFSVFIVEDMIAAANVNMQDDLALTLRDPRTNRENAVYASGMADASAGLMALTTVDFDSQRWMLRVQSRPDFEDALLGSREPDWILAGGTAATLLLFTLAWTMASTQQRANELAVRMTAAWRESEARYGSLVAAAPEAIIIMNGAGHIVAWNRGARGIYGYAEEDIVGESWTVLLPERLRLESGRLLRDAAQAEDPQARARIYEVIGRRASGEEFPAEVSLGRWRIGEKPFISAIIRDVSVRHRAEQALRISEERFRVALRVADITVFNQDRELRYSWIYNTAFGLRPEDVIGRTDDELFDHSDLTAFKREVLDTGRGGSRIFERDYRGERLTFNVVVEPLYEDERTTGLVGATINLTALRRAERLQRESEARFRAIFDNAAIGILVTDMQEQVMEANPAILRRLKLSLDEIRRYTPHAFVYPEDRELMIRLDSDLVEVGEPYVKQQVRYQCADGTLLWAGVTASLVRDDAGAPLLIVRMIEDITDLKAAESELHAAYRELERRVEERTAELAAKARELERSNYELEQFAYVASHDLQEPLRSVSGFAQLINRRYERQLDDQGRQFLQFIIAGTDRMRALVSGLLRYSRVGAKLAAFETVDTEDVLRQAQDNLAAAIAERQAELSHEPLPKVYGDPSELVQLFQNLIGNAIKFNESQPPRVHVNARPSSDQWEFSVSDNGVGIAEHDYERIFAIFQRAHGVGDYEGTGVGLAVCRKIVEHHQGRIWLQSHPGDGTTFYFTLPKP